MTNSKRAVLIVADGFGVGAMDDCAQVRPSSIGANSFLHVCQKEQTTFPHLEALGLTTFLEKPANDGLCGYRGIGKCALLHYGADSYEGHNEIMGNRPKMPEHQTMDSVGFAVEQALRDKGYDVYQAAGSSVRIVNHSVAVADNMETDPGQVINVSGCLDIVPFSTILDIGWTVRSVVKTNRVITLGGTRITEQDLLDSIISRGLSCGLDTPKLDIYNDSYQVCHMGYGVNPASQVQVLLEQAGIPVYLLGKMADVIDGNVHYRQSLVHTDLILDEIRDLLQTQPPGFVSATCQQTDLFGHMGDSASYAHVLAQIDAFLPELISILDDGDLLILTGDHGNDPTCCGSSHSREYTPFVVYIKDPKKHSLVSLGTRSTLSDVAATICDFYHVAPPESGSSALSQLLMNLK